MSNRIHRPVSEALADCHLIGQYPFRTDVFPDIESIVRSFKEPDFSALPFPERFKHIHQTLYRLITETASPAFLFGPVSDFFARVNREFPSKNPIDFLTFEFWLIHFSDISDEESEEIRGKITGKYIPRSDYQAFFPVGTGHSHKGTHFVAAHLSPDVDTMIASFWGWIDAFSSRIGTGLHIWSLPGGPPASPVTGIFRSMFGDDLFALASRGNKALVLTARDLLTRSSRLPEENRPLEKNPPFPVVSLKDDVDEMREKINGEDFLVVTWSDSDGIAYPVGIVKNSDLKAEKIGTISYRDFCNPEEVKAAPYLETISVIDHHKCFLKTGAPPTVIIADVQSCNVLIAEQMFLLNDRYSTGGMSREQIDEQMKTGFERLHSPCERRILGKLLRRLSAASENSSFYIHPQREFNEYFSFLHAIIDDTDLLTKASQRDLECVANLLNRLKSLLLGREVEIVNFDDIPKDRSFIKIAVRRLLEQEDMYSFYKEVYSARESEIETQMDLCLHEKPSDLFLDSKEQNGCARVGQTKLFASNFPRYMKHAHQIRRAWLKESLAVYSEKPEIKLYIHMVSTISGAEEAYRNRIGPYMHFDELWFWIPDPTGLDRLNEFLRGFSEKIKKSIETLTVKIIGNDTDDLEKPFSLYFPEAETIRSKARSERPLVVLRFKAGAVNSRKSMISPFLPRRPAS